MWHKHHSVIPVQEKSYLCLDFPEYVGPMDAIDAKIRYISPENSEIICTNGDKKKFEVKGRGYKYLPIKSTSKINIQLLSKDDKFSIDWGNSKRVIKKLNQSK